MIAYGIDYEVRGNKGTNGNMRNIVIDAKDLKSAKRKIGKKYGYTDGRMVKVHKVNVIGYF